MAFRQSEPVMGTIFSFDVRDPEVHETALVPVRNRLHALDAMFSTYREDSVVSRLNRGQLRLADAPEEVRFVYEQCEQWRARTGGWFDSSFAGPVDPSGYVKAWAIGQASAMLQLAGSRRHSVNGGGDIYAIGSADDEPWTFGIVDPRDSQQLLATATGARCAVATSGSAERGQHIYDPFRRQPAHSELLSLTIVGQDIIECDVLATAGFAVGSDALDWLRSYPGVQAFACFADGSSEVAPAAAAG